VATVSEGWNALCELSLAKEKDHSGSGQFENNQANIVQLPASALIVFIGCYANARRMSP
jgi:hypothetical protein